jgi:hypothetical protein
MSHGSRVRSFGENAQASEASDLPEGSDANRYVEAALPSLGAAGPSHCNGMRPGKPREGGFAMSSTFAVLVTDHARAVLARCD